MLELRSFRHLPSERYRVPNPGPDTIEVHRLLQQNWPTGKQQLGRFGEDLVFDLVTDLGATVLDRNWHCRYGELDLVVRMPPGCVHVLEVRTRTTAGSHGTPLESITPLKARRLHRLFYTWAGSNRARLGCGDVDYFIDVVGVEPHCSRVARLSYYPSVV